ncbi:MAG: hypothetical protein ACRBDI_06195 [Alphaproteobacteria bacterium]
MSLLCYAENPGGANGIITLAMENSNVVICADGSAVKYIQDHGCLISEHIPDNVTSLVIGTAHGPDSIAFEYITWAREKNIPSFGYVDACVNTDNRFRGHTDNPLHYAPDFLFVTEDATVKAFADLGFDSSKIFKVGNPRYDFVEIRAKTLTKEKRDKKSLLFLADPVEPCVGDDYMNSGFDCTSAHDVRSYVLLDCILSHVDDIDITIKLHPRNISVDFQKYTEKCSVYDGRALGIDLAFQADIVIGTTTSLLAESSIIGVPTIAALLTERERWWLPHILPDNLIISHDKVHMKNAIDTILEGPPPYSMPTNKNTLCQNSGRKMWDIIQNHSL